MVELYLFAVAGWDDEFHDVFYVVDTHDVRGYLRLLKEGNESHGSEILILQIDLPASKQQSLILPNRVVVLRHVDIEQRAEVLLKSHQCSDSLFHQQPT